MKKWFFIFVLLFLIFTNNHKSEAATSQRNDIIFYNIEKPLNIYPLDNGCLIQYENKVLYKTNNIEIEIDGFLTSYDYKQGIIYFVTTYENEVMLNKISNKNLEFVKLKSDHDIRKMCIKDNQIYLFGSNNLFSSIDVYSENLEFIKQYNYLENANIVFNDALMYNNKWYIFGEKHGHTSNSEVNNVGNYNDVKSILLILNESFELETIKYFNHNEKNENGRFFKIEDDIIYYQFITENFTYLYKSNILFDENYLIKKTDNSYSKILLDVNNNYLVFENQESLTLTSENETINLGVYNNIYNYSISNGKLEIVHYNNNNILKTSIEEYHIEKLNPIIINYDKGNIDFTKDLNVLDEVEIGSYFSKVEVLCNTEFQKNISGVHNVELLIIRENHENIKISGQVEVNDYVNVVNGGVYCTGYSLKFLGIGSLNGIKINNGHNILERGEYKLEIVDNLGNITGYNFIIVDEYYKRNEEHVDFDITSFQNKEVEIKIPLDNIEVMEVYVNNEIINFLQKENELILYLPSSQECGIKEYCLNKIVTKESEYEINKKIKVNYLKQVPTINIIENSCENPNLSFVVDDPDQTLRYLEFKLSNSNYTKYIQYFFNQDFILTDNNFLDGVIEMYVCYDLSDGLIRKELVCQMDGSFKSLEGLLSINTKIETELIKQIDISLDMKKVSKLNNLLVNNQNIISKYSMKKDYTSLIISSILTGIIVIVLITFIIIKKRKKKKA